MRCMRCGTEVPDEQTVCFRCGTVLKPNLKSEKIKPKNFKHITKIIFFVIIILIIISSIYFNRIKNQRILDKITPIENLNVDYNSIHYINNLYKSDGRHYKYLLDDYQKEIYEKLIKAINNFEPVIVIENEKINSKYHNEYLLKIVDSINMDHPELIQLGTIRTIKNQIKTKTIGITYIMNKNELNNKIDEIQNIIDQIKKETKTLSEEEKAKYVYEYLSKNNAYDMNEEYIGYSAYNALSGNHTPSYLGYSKSSQILLQNIDIDSIMTIGTISNKIYAWNLVKLDDKYYYFDVTSSSYNNPNLRDAGFLKNSRSYKYIYKELIPQIKNKR